MVDAYGLVALNIQDTVHYRSKYIQCAAVVSAELVVAAIAVLILAVCSVLVSALKALPEIVLVLVPVYAILITVCSVAIADAICPSATSPGTSVGPSGFKSLSISLVNGLPQKVGSPVVSVVPGSVPIYTIAALCNARIWFDGVIAGADRSRSKLGVSPVPLCFALLFCLCQLLLHFFLALPVVFVAVIVSLSAGCDCCSEYGEQGQCTTGHNCLKIDCFQDNPLSARFDTYVWRGVQCEVPRFVN